MLNWPTPRPDGAAAREAAATSTADGTIKHCHKQTQRGRYCGRELLANGKCPGGYLHEGSPRYLPLWPSLGVLAAGVVLFFIALSGGFSFLGPFAVNGVPTVGHNDLVSGSQQLLTKGETYGLYALYSCRGADKPSDLLAVLSLGATTLHVHASASEATYSETPFFTEDHAVKECGSFVAPRTGAYNVSFASTAPGILGVVPNAALLDYRLYQVSFLGGPLVIVIGVVALLFTRRQRDNARDPSEDEDLSHDPIARAARTAFTAASNAAKPSSERRVAPTASAPRACGTLERPGGRSSEG